MTFTQKEKFPCILDNVAITRTNQHGSFPTSFLIPNHLFYHVGRRRIMSRHKSLPVGEPFYESSNHFTWLYINPQYTVLYWHDGISQPEMPWLCTFDMCSISFIYYWGIRLQYVDQR